MLIVASVVGLVSLGLFYLAHTVVAFAVATALQGFYRALDSGPLEAWYVDARLAAAPGTRLERGLSAGSVAGNTAIGTGALLSGGLVDRRPVPGLEPLAVPLLVALALNVVSLVAIVGLVTEARGSRGVLGLRHGDLRNPDADPAGRGGPRR